MLPSGKLRRGYEEDRAGLYGILPMQHQQGLSAEQVADMKDLAPKLSDDEEKSKKRMIKIATQGDLRQLYFPHLTAGNKFALETDFNHFDGALSDPQHYPSRQERSAPPTRTFAETLQNALSNAQISRNEFVGTAGGGPHRVGRGRRQ